MHARRTVEMSLIITASFQLRTAFSYNTFKHITTMIKTTSHKMKTDPYQWYHVLRTRSCWFANWFQNEMRLWDSEELLFCVRHIMNLRSYWLAHYDKTIFLALFFFVQESLPCSKRVYICRLACSSFRTAVCSIWYGSMGLY